MAENLVVGTENFGVGARTRKSMVSGRRKLSNITNTVQPLGVPSIPKDDGFDQLKKDKMTLMTILAERNKTIEMKDIEIQKLQFELQSVLQQNRLLALSNSQMLTESNLGKDRLKAMQHELGCVKAVHKVKTLELEMAKKQQCIGVTVDMKDEVPKLEEMTEETRLVNLSSPPLDQSLCSTSLISHPVATNGKDNTQRTRQRQQSGTFKSEICQAADDVKGDIEPLIPSMHGDTITELDCPASASSTVCNFGDPVKSGRDSQSSIGRPSRRAAEKVKSYKEPPLKNKMRRSE